MKNLASNLSILEKFMTESGNIFLWDAVPESLFKVGLRLFHDQLNQG